MTAAPVLFAKPALNSMPPCRHPESDSGPTHTFSARKFFTFEIEEEVRGGWGGWGGGGAGIGAERGGGERNGDWSGAEQGLERRGAGGGAAGIGAGRSRDWSGARVTLESVSSFNPTTPASTPD